MVVRITLGNFEDLIAISPLFILMGSVLILGYLTPIILGKMDDRRIQKDPTPVIRNTKHWKCTCGVMLVNHLSCAGCIVLNSVGVQAYCPDCENHPMDSISC
jgi:hypothetical protein